MTINKTSPKLSLTVGIAAFNEEANIQKLLQRVLRQKEDIFSLRKIIIISDASTDETYEKATAISDPRIHVAKNQRRIGQSAIYNIIFEQADTDIIVLLEADTLPEGDNYLSNLLAPFSQFGVGLVQGNDLALPARSWIGRVLYAQYQIFNRLNTKNPEIRSWLSSGRGGRAISSRVYSQLRWPKGVPEDNYALLWCKKRNVLVVFQATAICRFKLPETYEDFLLVRQKIAAGLSTLEHHFTKKDVAKIYTRPWWFNAWAAILLAFFYPWEFIGYLYLLIRRQFYKRSVYTDFWPIAKSTKILE